MPVLNVLLVRENLPIKREDQIMEVSDAVLSISEVAVTLVGFAAVFRAFRGESVDPHSGPRTLVVIEVGLALVLLCYLPTLAAQVGLRSATAYRVVGGLTVLYWLRWLVVYYQLRNQIHATPGIFRSCAVMSFLIFGAGLGNSLALWTPPEALYFVSVLAALAQVGLSFLAQFKAESGGLASAQAAQGGQINYSP